MIDKNLIKKKLGEHEYATVDIKKVYDVLHNQLDDFRKFARYVNAYLALHGKE